MRLASGIVPQGPFNAARAAVDGGIDLGLAGFGDLPDHGIVDRVAVLEPLVGGDEFAVDEVKNLVWQACIESFLFSDLPPSHSRWPSVRGVARAHSFVATDASSLAPGRRYHRSIPSRLPGKWHAATEDDQPGPGGKTQFHGASTSSLWWENETGCGVGLVDGDIDRVQKGTRHAQEGDQIAAAIGYRNIDLPALFRRMIYRCLNGSEGGSGGDAWTGGCHLHQVTTLRKDSLSLRS
jgi:hypothetical protein